MEKYLKQYLSKLNDDLVNLPPKNFQQIIEIILKAYRNGKNIFIIGNGGSAATASHFANDLNKGTLGHSGKAKYKRFKALCLTDNISLLTAWSNDCDYENSLAEILKNYIQKGDILFTISASGNSPNIIAAVKVAKKSKAKIIALVGFNGGKLKKISDYNLHINDDSYARIEDAHLIICHIIGTYIYEILQKKTDNFS